MFRFLLFIANALAFRQNLLIFAYDPAVGCEY